MVRTTTGKENEGLLAAKALQRHKPAACDKNPVKVQVSNAADTDELCQNFSILTIGGVIDEQAPKIPEPASKVANTDQNSSSASASTAATASKVNTTAEISFKTPFPTRPAPRTAFKRKPLGNASINNAAVAQQQAGLPTAYQPPLPVNPIQAPATPQAPLNGAPAALPAGPYNSYQLPMLPMYPPYTPHPACFDPSGRFSASGSPQAVSPPAVLNFGSSQTLKAWSPDGHWGLPSPSSDNDECTSPALSHLNSPQGSSWYDEDAWSPPPREQPLAFWPQQPVALWPQPVMIVPVPVLQETAFVQQETDGRDAAAETLEPRREAETPQSDGFWSGAAGIADSARSWRRTEPLQTETLRAGFELSMRQMASMCFQASSKGSKAELPKAAVKALVEHQIKSHGPLRAPWYRQHSPKSFAWGGERQETPENKENGTGVWIPRA